MYFSHNQSKWERQVDVVMADREKKLNIKETTRTHNTRKNKKRGEKKSHTTKHNNNKKKYKNIYNNNKLK